jgi:hypothetical protein
VTALDPPTIALIDKAEPLTITNSTRETTCCLSGCPISPHDWIVQLKRSTRVACPGCAEDHGWKVVG